MSVSDIVIIYSRILYIIVVFLSKVFIPRLKTNIGSYSLCNRIGEKARHLSVARGRPFQPSHSIQPRSAHNFNRLPVNSLRRILFQKFDYICADVHEPISQNITDFSFHHRFLDSCYLVLLQYV